MAQHQSLNNDGQDHNLVQELDHRQSTVFCTVWTIPLLLHHMGEHNLAQELHLWKPDGYLQTAETRAA